MTTNIDHAVVDFEGEHDSWCLGVIAQILLRIRMGEPTVSVRTTVPKMRAIIRGCSGFAAFTALDPEWYKMGTAANSKVNPLKAYNWKFQIEPKKL